MMKIELTYATMIVISYDGGRFDTPAMSLSLENAIAIATMEIKTHNFTMADIIDADTGEILAIITNDDDEDSDPGETDILSA